MILGLAVFVNDYLISSVQEAIRSELSKREWRYRELADRVGVAEVSIKRWMTGSDLSLLRVGKIAAALELTPFQLLERAERGVERSFVLDTSVEEALVADPVVHRVWESLRLGHGSEAIRTHYGLDHASWLKALGRLEALGLVEQHPEDRLRLLHDGVHNWQREGPLWHHHRGDHLEALRGPLDGTVPSVLQAATRVVGPDFWEEAEVELLGLARVWRDRAWRDQTTVPRSAQRRVRWTLVLAEAPDFP